MTLLQKRLTSLSQRREGSSHNVLIFDNLIGVEELADALGMAPQTIRNWVSLRKIPFIKVGNRVCFRVESINAWLDHKEVKPWQ